MRGIVLRALSALLFVGLHAAPAAAQDPLALQARGIAAQARQQVQSLSVQAGVQGASLTRWRACRGKLRLALLSTCKAAFVGDSKTAGAGAGTGAQYLIGAFPLSRPSRLAALLTVNGLSVRTDSWFGSAGNASIANVLTYDPRRSGFSGWGGGAVSLGGPALASGNTNPGNFQPSRPVDRVSVFYKQSSGGGQFTVAKGAESFAFNAANATNAIIRGEVIFTTKSAEPIVVTRTGGGYVDLVGEIAWDSATPAIEIANFGVYGVKTAYQADTTSAWSPRSALAAYAPDLTVVNLGTNDLNATGTTPLGDYLTALQQIVTTAKVSGDCILEWPSIAATTYGSDAVRASWRDAVAGLAMSNGCGFQDDEALLGGRTTATTMVTTADGIHEQAWAYDIEAQPLLRYVLQ